MEKVNGELRGSWRDKREGGVKKPEECESGGVRVMEGSEVGGEGAWVDREIGGEREKERRGSRRKKEEDTEWEEEGSSGMRGFEKRSELGGWESRRLFIRRNKPQLWYLRDMIHVNINKLKKKLIE